MTTLADADVARHKPAHHKVAALEAEGIPELPAEPAALRAHLLDAIARIRPILEADAEANDAGATLAWSSVAALYREGLLSLKVPRALGGPEVDPLLYLELVDELSYINPSAGVVRFYQCYQYGLAGGFSAGWRRGADFWQRQRRRQDAHCIGRRYSARAGDACSRRLAGERTLALRQWVGAFVLAAGRLSHPAG